MSYVSPSPGLSGLPGAEVPAAAASSMLGGAPAPDKDSIKLFVGQVPRSHDEADLRQIFEKYGTICDLKVLKDPYTGFHRGKDLLSSPSCPAADLPALGEIF